MTNKGFSDYFRPRMNLVERAKAKVKKAHEEGIKLNLRQISEISGVSYAVLQRFMKRENYKLSAVDAEKILNADV